jgi:hypothetical protein
MTLCPDLRGKISSSRRLLFFLIMQGVNYRGFHTHFIASREQATVHGPFPVSGLHDEQVYLIFFRCSSVTAATVLSSKSISIVSIFKAF